MLKIIREQAVNQSFLCLCLSLSHTHTVGQDHTCRSDVCAGSNIKYFQIQVHNEHKLIIMSRENIRLSEFEKKNANLVIKIREKCEI